MKQIKLHGYPVNVGDAVWSVIHGNGTVVEVRKDSDPLYAIHVKFDDDTIQPFSPDGLFLSNDPKPTLYWQEFEIPALARVKPTAPDMSVAHYEYRKTKCDEWQLGVVESSDFNQQIIYLVESGYEVRKV